MRISKDTLAIIKNFAQLNTNLVFKPGNNITTITATKTVMADAAVAEMFPQEFGIYDLNQFLGVMSLFDTPELTFTDSYVLIEENHNSVKYYAASPSVLTSVPPLKKLPAPDVEFQLTQQMINQIHKVAAILSTDDVIVVGDGDTVKLMIGDKKNPTSNTFASVVGSTDKRFQINLKAQNLKLLSGDYAVKIAGKRVACFSATSQPLNYYIALELDSTFDF